MEFPYVSSVIGVRVAYTPEATPENPVPVETETEVIVVANGGEAENAIAKFKAAMASTFPGVTYRIVEANRGARLQIL
jgi:hypothetical protein